VNRYLVLMLVLSLLAGCGAEPTAGASRGDPTNGEKLFREGAVPACSTCHSLAPGVGLPGPSLARIGRTAGSRVPGQSAADYLRESILEPNAHIAFGFSANVMAAAYEAQLSEQEVDDLTAYLMTLK
jgi:mono/diheme cytochrome c family protein